MSRSTVSAPALAGEPARSRAAGRGGTPQRTDRPFRGIALVVLSTVFLACSDALAKYLARDLPPIEITWIRFVVFALIMSPAIVMPRGGSVLRSSRPMIQMLRGLGLLGSSLFFIWGLRFLPIAEASATAFVSPIFVTGLSIVVLGEKVGVRRWIATVVGLIGVLIVVRPGTAAFDPAAIFPIVSAFAWASTLVLTRQISGVDRPVTTMVWSALVGLAVLSVPVPFVWVTPSWFEIGLGICVGVASTAGHWVVVLAYRHADASVLAPFSYSQLLWVSILGFLIFAEVPGVWTLVGAAVIIGSGLYTAHRERVRRSQRPLPVKPYPSA